MSRHVPQDEGRSVWWWLFCMPGAALLWFQYMYPHSLSGSFGSARRKNVKIIQFAMTMVLYALAALALTHLDATANVLAILATPFVAIFQMLKG